MCGWHRSFLIKQTENQLCYFRMLWPRLFKDLLFVKNLCVIADNTVFKKWRSCTLKHWWRGSSHSACLEFIPALPLYYCNGLHSGASLLSLSVFEAALNSAGTHKQGQMSPWWRLTVSNDFRLYRCFFCSHYTTELSWCTTEVKLHSSFS